MANWFTFRNEAASKKATIEIRGVIGIPKMYEEYGYNAAGTAKDFAKELKALGEVEEIEMRVYSPGGYIFDSMAIHDLLVNHPATITAKVEGLVASAASWIIHAADKIEMPANAWMMIHNVQGIAMGDHREMQKASKDMEKFSDDLAAMYVNKVRQVKGRAKSKTKAEIRAMMDSETWMNGEEAGRLGFVDVVTGAVELTNLLGGAELEGLKTQPGAVNLDKAPEEVRALLGMGGIDKGKPTTANQLAEDMRLKSALQNAADENNGNGGGGGGASNPPALTVDAMNTAIANAVKASADSFNLLIEKANNTIKDLTSKVDAQATTITDLTARVEKAENLVKSGVTGATQSGKAIDDAANTDGKDKKTMNRAEFGKLNPSERANFLRNGGKLTD